MAAGKSWLLWLILIAAALLPAQAQEVFYIHTDALGTVVAETDANGNVVERSEYEPYGKVLNRPVKNGPGYTGHVEDAATGLTYMQQRYYDPGVGRFLSVDPVTADGNTGGNFNRYWYANNNPYRFTDPDGRAGEEVNRLVTLATNIVLGVRDDVVAVANAAVNDQPLPLGPTLRLATLPLAAELGAVGSGARGAGAAAVTEARAGSAAARADFVVTPSGTSIPTSQSRMLSGLEAAGMPGRPLPAGGTAHTLPNGVTVRAMEPSGQAPQRASFNNANGGPVTPDGKVPQPPRGSSPQERRDFVRERTHVEQTK